MLMGDGKHPDVLTNDYLANWSQPDMGRHSCRHHGKREKYAEIIQSHIFVPIAIETLERIKIDGQRLFDSLGERLSSVSASSYLYRSKF